MSLTATEIVEVLTKAKELGFTYLKLDGFEVNMTDETPLLTKSVVPELEAEDIIKPLSTLDGMSEEKILYWSTPHYDELVAQEDLSKRAVEEHKGMNDEHG